MWFKSLFKTSFPFVLPFSGVLQSFIGRLSHKEGVVTVFKVIISLIKLPVITRLATPMAPHSGDVAKNRFSLSPPSGEQPENYTTGQPVTSRDSQAGL